MGNENPSNLNTERTAPASGDVPKREVRRRTNADQTGKNARKSKKDQLIGLLSKPSGARVSVLADRLQWQAHTVRAALSGLRKQGYEIATSKSAKTGETVYTITDHPAANNGDAAGADVRGRM